MTLHNNNIKKEKAIEQTLQCEEINTERSEMCSKKKKRTAKIPGGEEIKKFKKKITKV